MRQRQNIPEEVIENIRRNVFLPDLMQAGGVRLRRQGKEWRGKCPFEGGSNPTKLVVGPERYYCHGCRATGDVFSWLQHSEQISFMDAVKRAAGEAGIDLEPYLRREKDGGTRKVDPRREAVDSLLATLAELSLEAAESLPAEARVRNGVDLSALIASGEIGFLPDREVVKARLRSLGVERRALDDAGLSHTGDALAGHWVIWARQGERVVGGRPLGADGPVIGYRGANSRGWVLPAGPRRYMAPTRVALDDDTYISFRSAGQSVVRPLTPETISAKPLRSLSDREKPPVYFLRPDVAIRKAAFPAALAALRVHPRSRVSEMDPLPGPLAGSEAWESMVEKEIERAGTVMDWQIGLIMEHRATGGRLDNLAAATKLAKIVTATEAPLERLAYQLELESFTGHSYEETVDAAEQRRAVNPTRDVPANRRSSAVRAERVSPSRTATR